jgi:hypothetical protein
MTDYSFMETEDMEALLEQRKAGRTNLAWPVSVWVPEANRFFNGRSCNISKGGVLIRLPITVPIRPGHAVELNFPRTASLAREKGQFARIRSGKVIRVDRNSVLKDAEIGIGVAFD